MDENIKTRPLRFPVKENPNMEKALFDLPIVCVAEWRQSKISIISWKLSGTKFFKKSVRLTNQKPSAFVSVR